MNRFKSKKRCLRPLQALRAPLLTPPLQNTFILSLLLGLLGCIGESKHEGYGPHISVTLVSDQSSTSKGTPFHLGVLFKPDPGWHIYWKNPGDSGLAPTFRWKASDLAVDTPLWPAPTRIEFGPLVNYGYEDVLIPFPARFTEGASHGAQEITVETDWLVCKDECLPGSATLSLSVDLSDSPPEKSSQAAMFSNYLQKVPSRLDQVSLAIEEREKDVVLSLVPSNGQRLPVDLTFFPFENGVINNAAPQKITTDGASVKIVLLRDSSHTRPIGRISGVLVSNQGWGDSEGTALRKAVWIDTDDSQAAAVPPSTTLNQRAVNSALPTTSESRLPLLTALLFALIGGFILNLMPCVFPVLSIKILGFIHHSNDEPRKIRLHGIAFCLGVLVSFWILAVFLLALRAGGAQLGWGFQLQSPLFVALMTGVFFLLGLSFIVELSFGSSIQTLACKSKLPASLAGSFLNGALATVVATPCTGPFMGSALAATISLPTVQSLLIFTALGLGMSSPYLVLAFQPALLKRLPKPGEWTITFRQLMAFPLFASAIWLLRVFGRQLGLPSLALGTLLNVLWGMLACSFGFWILSRASHSASNTRRRFAAILCFVFIALGVWIGYPRFLGEGPHGFGELSSYGEQVTEKDRFGLQWERFSENRLNQLLEQGRPVYLDFTAEWCITCQVNERVVFGSQNVREVFQEKKVALLKGDWTSMDPNITKALERYGRNGVPLNVFYSGARGADAKPVPPVIFPNILTPGVVVEEVMKVGQ